jgi:hypothetical protein
LVKNQPRCCGPFLCRPIPDASPGPELTTQEGGHDHFHEKKCEDSDGQDQHADDVKRIQLVPTFLVIVIENVFSAFDAQEFACRQRRSMSALADNVFGGKRHDYTSE